MNAMGSPKSYEEKSTPDLHNYVSIKNKIQNIGKQRSSSKRYRIRQSYSNKKQEKRVSSQEIISKPKKSSRIRMKKIGKSTDAVIKVSVKKEKMLKRIFEASSSSKLKFPKNPMASRSPKRAKRYANSVLRLKRRLESEERENASSSQRNSHNQRKKKLFNSYFIHNIKNSISNSNLALKSLKELASSFGSARSSNKYQRHRKTPKSTQRQKNRSQFLNKIDSEASSQKNFGVFSHNQKWLHNNLLHKISSPGLSSEKNLFKKKSFNFFSKLKNSKSKEAKKKRNRIEIKEEEHLSKIKEFLSRKKMEKVRKRSSQRSGKKLKKSHFIDAINVSRSRSRESGEKRFPSGGRKRERMSKYMFQESSGRIGKLGRFNFDAQKEGVFKSLRNKIRRKIHGVKIGR